MLTHTHTQCTHAPTRACTHAETHAYTHTDTHTNTQTQGFVYVKFEAVEAAVAARAALHGRFYSGLQIHAEFQFERLYSSVFHC